MISAPSRKAALIDERVLPLPHVHASAKDGRTALRHDLADRGVPIAVSDAAVLVVSELVSNAVRHARPLSSGKVELAWSIDDDGGVTVLVRDGGSATRPRAYPLTRSATGGRGLGIVDAVAHEWGVDEEYGRTTVWARLVDPATHRRRPQAEDRGSGLPIDDADTRGAAHSAARPAHRVVLPANDAMVLPPD